MKVSFRSLIGLLAVASCSKFAANNSDSNSLIEGGRSSEMTVDAGIATPVASTAIVSTPQLPPGVVFTGVHYWDRVATLYENPIIFVTDMEVNLDIFDAADGKIAFGLRLTDLEVKRLNSWTTADIKSALRNYLAHFNQEVRRPLVFCIFTANINATVKAVFSELNISYYSPQEWSERRAMDSKTPYLYVDLNSGNSETTLTRLQAYNNGQYKPCCGCLIC